MRGLKILVISMAILIVAGFVVLVSELGSRVSQLSSSPVEGAAPFAEALGAPDGSTVEGITGLEGRLAIHIRWPDGRDRVYLVDPASGRHLGTLSPDGTPQ